MQQEKVNDFEASVRKQKRYNWIINNANREWIYSPAPGS